MANGVGAGTGFGLGLNIPAGDTAQTRTAVL
jgi:hypothetical protein